MQWRRAAVGFLGRGRCGPVSGGWSPGAEVWALSALLMAVACGAPVWAEAEVVAASGGVVRADVVTFEQGGAVQVRGPAGERRLGPDELVSVRLAPPLGIGSVRRGLVLTTGETWSGQVRSLSGESVVLKSPLLGEVTFSRREVAAVVAADSVSLTDLLTAPPGTVVLENGDRVEGQLQTIQGGVATFSSDLGKLDVALERVAYVKSARFPPGWGPVGRPLAAVILADGDWLLGEILGETEGNLLLRRGTGLKPFAQPVEVGDTGSSQEEEWLELRVPKAAVSEVRYLGRRVVYLSDLEPTSVEEKPFFEYLLPWKRDLSVGGGRLTLRRRVFHKGLGVHSYCRLAYDLGGRYTRFASVIGIDDEARGKGTCTFEVWVDGDRRFASGALTGRDDPRSVEVDVSGAKELALVVDFGEAGDVVDRADWADAYLVKKEQP